MRRRVAPVVLTAVREHRRTACVAASAALLIPVLLLPPNDSGDEDDQRLQHDFASAAEEFHVPQSVLMGVSYLQSRWDAHPGSPSVDNGYGPMHLVDALHNPPADPSGRPQALAGPPPVASTHAQLPAELERAARLTGTPAKRLRTDASANVRGGAALLAATQRDLGRALSENPADWWDAVSRFPGASDTTAAATYANDVFDVIRKGAARTTDTGQQVSLPASPGVRPRVAPKEKRPAQVECPPDTSCDWLSAPYVQIDDDAYGNHDLGDRPKDQRIEYIVIHDTEASLTSMLKTVQVPTEASWHYSVRSSDGHITQHVRTKDAAWHSGNQFVNARSIGVEHEGFLTQPDAWYTEEMYRSSARLVRWLAQKYDIPMDRQHIFGHDNVPSPTTDSIPGMHEDPGPYWDWRHYFDLLGAPLKATAAADSDMVMILPDYRTHKPRFLNCRGEGSVCPPHGSSAVRLYTEPDENSDLIQDPGRHPDGEESTEGVSDMGSRVSAGQLFAVAERRGDWTAIWFQGQKAWFENPKKDPTAVGATGKMITPKRGLDEVPVFGRALPEGDAYPEGVEEQPELPLPYSVLAGQRYVTQDRLKGSYIDRSSFEMVPSPVIKGQEQYYEIQIGHRLGYVRASDVDLIDGPPALAAPKGQKAGKSPTAPKATKAGS